MIAAFVTDATEQALRQLNRRGIYECIYLQAKTVDAAHKLVEGGESYSHIIIDLNYFYGGDVDAALDLAERLLQTTASALVTVVPDMDFSKVIMQDIKKVGVQARNIISSSASQFKKQFLELLLRDGVVKDPADMTDACAFYEPNVSYPLELLSDAAQSEQLTLTASAQIFTEDPSPMSLCSTESVPPDLSPVANPPFETDLPSEAVSTPPSPNTLTIAVAGAGVGIGCTTQAMQLLLYLKSQGVDAALIEMQARHSLKEYLEVFETQEIIDETHFCLQDVDIYLGGKCVSKARARHEYLIFDYGNYSEIADITAFLEKDIRIVVAGTKPWQTPLLYDVFDSDDGSIQYLFSSVPLADQSQVKALMLESAAHTFFSDYAPDFFRFCGNELLYAALLGETPITPRKEKTKRQRKGLFSKYRSKLHKLQKAGGNRNAKAIAACRLQGKATAG